jgi:hypothetical protein
VAVVALIGALSMIVDAGVFFVIQRQLQSAADSAALASVWYGQPCYALASGDWHVAARYGCYVFNPIGNYVINPDTVAQQYVTSNASTAIALCAGPTLPNGAVVLKEPGDTTPVAPGSVAVYPSSAQLIVPKLNTYQVTVTCDAPRWFGRIFPNLSANVHLSASSIATIGWLDPSGQLTSEMPTTPNPRLSSRLIG